jgi:uncharacterized membrane protein
MEKILVVLIFIAAVLYLGWRIRKAVLRTRKKDCGPDCNCE